MQIEDEIFSACLEIPDRRLKFHSQTQAHHLVVKVTLQIEEEIVCLE